MTRSRIYDALGVCIVINLTLTVRSWIPALNAITANCGGGSSVTMQEAPTRRRPLNATNPSMSTTETKNRRAAKVASTAVPLDLPVCVDWNIQMDDWWTHYPEYDEGTHNDTHQCFDRLTNDFQIAQYYQIHQVQFHSNCADKVTVRTMWNSGWEADLTNVVKGIIVAVQTKIPLQMTVLGMKRAWWHYAALRETGENATCPQKDMSCYFLPLSRCRAKGEIEKDSAKAVTPQTRWVIDYITRSQQWLRKAVYDYLKEKGPKIQGQCSVIHVRRSDVVLHDETSRKYYAISDYIDKLPEQRREKGSNIVLLTDDANAIDEALEFFPDLKWHYLNRPRHHGDEGGWENQVPSKNPALEVIVIKSIFRMVRPCDVIVHGYGGFSNAIHGSMQNGMGAALRFRVEGNNTKSSVIFNEGNARSKVTLQKILDEKRKIAD
jgi:hypothetical protein